MSFVGVGGLNGYTLCTAQEAPTMTPTTPPITTTHDAAATDRLSALATKPLWLVGVGAVVAGAVVTALFAAIADAAGVPLEVASESGGTPEAIPVAGFGTLVLAAGAIGVLLALALDRWTSRPARTFAIVATVLTVASLVTPFIAQEATTATRVVLGLAHVVAAAVIIPLITTRLAQGEARS
jgi:hypothetical protein